MYRKKSLKVSTQKKKVHDSCYAENVPNCCGTSEGRIEAESCTLQSSTKKFSTSKTVVNVSGKNVNLNSKQNFGVILCLVIIDYLILLYGKVNWMKVVFFCIHSFFAYLCIRIQHINFSSKIIFFWLSYIRTKCVIFWWWAFLRFVWLERGFQQLLPAERGNDQPELSLKSQQALFQTGPNSAQTYSPASSQRQLSRGCCTCAKTAPTRIDFGWLGHRIMVHYCQIKKWQ